MYTKDAIFKAGKIHGCEDDLYIVYFNPDSTVPSWEELHVDRDTALRWADEIPEATYTKWGAEAFMEMLNSECSLFWTEELDDYKELYHLADYIDNGNIVDEARYIINWAKEA